MPSTMTHLNHLEKEHLVLSGLLEEKMIILWYIHCISVHPSSLSTLSSFMSDC